MELTEGRLRFTFPDDWSPKPSIPDGWAFYRRQFSRNLNGVEYICLECKARVHCASCNSRVPLGVKAVDFAAIDTSNTVWLIEVKDYRFHQRTKAIDLADELAIKVRDSLALILAAATNANDPDEKAMAIAIARASCIRVVAHIEQTVQPTRLRPRNIDLVSVREKLRRLIRFLDPHPYVVESNYMSNLQWTTVTTN